MAQKLNTIDRVAPSLVEYSTLLAYGCVTEANLHPVSVYPMKLISNCQEIQIQQFDTGLPKFMRTHERPLLIQIKRLSLCGLARFWIIGPVLKNRLMSKDDVEMTCLPCSFMHNHLTIFEKTCYVGSPCFS